MRFSKRDNSYKESSESPKENDNSVADKLLQLDEKIIKFMQEEFESTKFTVNKLSQGNGQKLYDELKFRKDKFEEDVLKQLKEVVVDNNTGEHFSGYDPETKSIHISERFYGMNVTKEDMVGLLSFEDMIQEEIWHSLFDTFNLQKDKDMKIFFKQNRPDILKYCHILGIYESREKQEEFFVRAFYKFEKGQLDTMTNNKEFNLKLSKFIEEKYESLLKRRK